MGASIDQAAAPASELPMRKLMVRLLHDENGVTAIEYALIGTLISLAIFSAAVVVGSHLSTTFNTVATKL
jgi:pilus assembly protein Flp/PilA